MNSLYILKEKTSREIISDNYAQVKVLSDRIGHVCIQQIDDCIWLDDKDLELLIDALVEIKNANNF